MANTERLDFASMLDELIAEHENTISATPAAQTLDYLSVADELAGRISISEDAARATYRDVGDDLADLSAKPNQAGPPPPTDRDSVARELDLSRLRKPRDFDRVRREFALRNHPDRVADHLREGSMIRMQIANMLIDEAKRRLVRRSKTRAGSA